MPRLTNLNDIMFPEPIQRILQIIKIKICFQ